MDCGCVHRCANAQVRTSAHTVALTAPRISYYTRHATRCACNEPLGPRHFDTFVTCQNRVEFSRAPIDLNSKLLWPMLSLSECANEKFSRLPCSAFMPDICKFYSDQQHLTMAGSWVRNKCESRKDCM